MADAEGIRVYDMPEAPLSSLRFHNCCEGVTRRAPEGFPLHVAVHEVSVGTSSPRPYVDLHMHQMPEINILVSGKEPLEYRFLCNGRETLVRAPACVWIPARVPHAASVVSGSGLFVCLLLAGGYDAANAEEL